MHLPLDHLRARRRIYHAALDRYAFRVATPDDVEGIISLWPEHWEEAHYKDRGIEPDEARYRAWLTKRMTYGAGVWLLAIDEADNSVVGFFEYSLDHNFLVQAGGGDGHIFCRQSAQALGGATDPVRAGVERGHRGWGLRLPRADRLGDAVGEGAGKHLSETRVHDHRHDDGKGT